MTNPELNKEVAISALRGLAAAGYFSKEQLNSMEEIITNKKVKSRPDKQWMTIKEACFHSKLSRTSLWKLYTSGRLETHVIAGRRLIEQSELDSVIFTGDPILRVQSPK